MWLIISIGIIILFCIIKTVFAVKNGDGALDDESLNESKQYIFYVVGTKYYHVDKLHPSPNGYAAELIDEPDNKYDHNAIGVYFDGIKVGHIGRNQTKKVKQIMLNSVIEDIHGYVLDDAVKVYINVAK